MVIAQFVEGDGPGGTERLVIQLALELRRRGHTVLTVGPADGPGKGWLGSEFRRLGFEWLTVPKRSMFDPRAVTDVTRFIRSRDVDVVHSHEFAPSIYGAAGAWLTRRNHCLTMHSNLYFAAAWRRRAAFRWATRHSGGVVAVSADTRADVEKLLALPRGTVQVIPNGIAATPGRRELLRNELGVSAAELLIVALGNVSARKSHITILEALIRLHRERPDLQWRFAIAGTDHGSAAHLLEFASEHGVADLFHLLGHRSDTEDVLAGADLFAMSSLHEGMPLAIIEAMFAEKAIVSTAAGGIAEMITHDVEGLLTPTGDVDAMAQALERLLSNRADRERMSVAARRRAERQFGITPMVDAYLGLYRKGPRRIDAT